MRAELDAGCAKLCGLTGNELRYIPDLAGIYGSDFPSETFRIVKNTGLTLAPLSVGWGTRGS